MLLFGAVNPRVLNGAPLASIVYLWVYRYRNYLASLVIDVWRTRTENLIVRDKKLNIQSNKSCVRSKQWIPKAFDRSKDLIQGEITLVFVFNYKSIH